MVEPQRFTDKLIECRRDWGLSWMSARLRRPHGATHRAERPGSATIREEGRGVCGVRLDGHHRKAQAELEARRPVGGPAGPERARARALPGCDAICRNAAKNSTPCVDIRTGAITPSPVSARRAMGPVGHFYPDFYPRQTNRGGDRMISILPQDSQSVNRGSTPLGSTPSKPAWYNAMRVFCWPIISSCKWPISAQGSTSFYPCSTPLRWTHG